MKSSKEYAKKDSGLTLSELQGWLQFATEAAKRKHWEYFVIDQFLKGNHSIKGNPADNSLVLTKTNQTVNFPINRIYTAFRAVRAFVTRHKPEAVIDPQNFSEEALKYARRANKLLERDNLLNNGRRLNKELVYFGIKYGLGWRQIGYDPVKKVSIRWSIDPWDMLVGSQVAEPADAPFIIKSLVRTVGYWRKKFPNKNIQPDNQLAHDEYKQLSLNIQGFGQNNNVQRTEEQTALGYEVWYRVFEPNKNGGLINKCLFTSSDILDMEETPYTEYPFVTYQAEVVPNEPYPDSYTKQLIAPQRMLNLLNTQLLEYNHIVNRGRFAMEKNSGFSVINSKEGQIITHNPGKRVEIVNPPMLSKDLVWQIQYADSVIEDIGGQHDASQGNTPARVSSGAAIEALQLGDSNNISDLRDNFEDTLSQEAAWILKMYSMFEAEGVVITDKVKGKVDQFAVVGEMASKKQNKPIPEKYYIEDNGEYCDVCAILPENQVKVSVISKLGETREARTELLFKLIDYGLPLKVALEHLEFPNTSDALERIAEETVADTMLETMQAPTAGQPIPESTLPMQDDELAQALSEIDSSL